MSASESRCAGFVGFAASTDTELLLSEYVDGELSAAEAAFVEAHVAGCPACASELAFLRATSFVMTHRTPDVYPPADLFARVAQMTYARPTWKQRIARFLAPTPVRWGIGTALAAGVISALVLPQMLRSQNVNGNATNAIPNLATNPTTPSSSDTANNSGGAESVKPEVASNSSSLPPTPAETHNSIATATTGEKPVVPSSPADIARDAARASHSQTAMIADRTEPLVRPVMADRKPGIPAHAPQIATNTSRTHSGLISANSIHYNPGNSGRGLLASRGGIRTDDRINAAGFFNLAAPATHTSDNAGGDSSTPPHVDTQVAMANPMPARTGEGVVEHTAPPTPADVAVVPGSTPSHFTLNLKGAGTAAPTGSYQLSQAGGTALSRKDQPIPGKVDSSF